MKRLIVNKPWKLTEGGWVPHGTIEIKYLDVTSSKHQIKIQEVGGVEGVRFETEAEASEWLEKRYPKN